MTRHRVWFARRVDEAGRPLSLDVRSAGRAFQRYGRRGGGGAYDVLAKPRRHASRSIVDVAAVQTRLSARTGNAARFILYRSWLLSRRPACSVVQVAGQASDGNFRCPVCRIALAVSSVGTWFLMIVSTRVQRRFRDKVTIVLESHVARLQASVATIAHHERPEYLDRLSMLRNQIFVLDHMYVSAFSTVGWILRLAITIALLMSIHPLLFLLA